MTSKGGDDGSDRAVAKRPHGGPRQADQIEELHRVRAELRMRSRSRGSCFSGSLPPVAPNAFVYSDDIAHRAVQHTLEVLGSDRSRGVYQRSGRLCRIVDVVREPGESTDGVRCTLPLPVDLDETRLQVELTALIPWQRRLRGGAIRPCGCPQIVARVVLNERAFPGVLVLKGTIQAPTLRPNGSLIDKEGYDEGTGLFYAPRGAVFPQVPLSPSRDDAVAALRILEQPIAKFPFVTEADRAVMLAAMLTALVRRVLPSSPLFAFNAAQAGSGKSMLANMLAILATGREAAGIPWTIDPEANRKALFSVLYTSDPVVLLDNLDAPLGGARLCEALTQPEIKDRILGSSGNGTVATNALFLASGNNLVIAEDMTRRALVCRIDARCEHPNERSFDFDPIEETKRRRGEMVAAGLTILRAWVVAGKPDLGLTPFGSFAAWSDLVRGALVWLGYPDPLAGQKRAVADDPKRRALAAFVSAWSEAFGDRGRTVAEVVRSIEENRGRESAYKNAALTMLDDAVTAIACEGVKINVRRLGHYLSKNRDRIVDGLRIEDVDIRCKVARWRVIRSDT